MCCVHSYVAKPYFPTLIFSGVVIDIVPVKNFAHKYIGENEKRGCEDNTNVYM